MADVTVLHPGMGHNQPPAKLDELDLVLGDPLDPKFLRDRLSRDHAALMRRFVELEQGAARAPKQIGSEDEATRLLDFVADQCRPVATDAKKAHDVEKKAYLECGKVIDDFFLRRIERFNLALNGVVRAAEDFLARKRAEQRRREEEQRRRAAEEQRRAQAEAQRLAREAQAAKDREAAAELERRSREEAERAAMAKAIEEAPPAPVRLHGDFGAVAFSTTKWNYEVVDPSALPLWALRPDDKAIRARIDRAIKETGQPPDIPGLEIVPEEKFTIRRC